MSVTVESLLQAQELCLQLGENVGVFDMSLSLQRGDVLGLLGLNGAGKSTTLRLLCGVQVPDSGSVFVAGHSMAEQPLLARAQIGFLPDQPPLFNDMRVADYLNFTAALRKIPSAAIADSVHAVISDCDLQSVSRQRIGLLSKGYRQRVGLAQAMVHKPAILLLDEPSNGLDPQQMDGMRNIIRNYAEHGAVVFSTHLLNEVQALCNRIAIVNNGRLIHDANVSADAMDDVEAMFTRLLHEEPVSASA